MAAAVGEWTVIFYQEVFRSWPARNACRFELGHVVSAMVTQFDWKHNRRVGCGADLVEWVRAALGAEH